MEKHIVCQKEIFVKKHFSNNKSMPIDAVIKLTALIERDMTKGGGDKCSAQSAAKKSATKSAPSYGMNQQRNVSGCAAV